MVWLSLYILPVFPVVQNTTVGTFLSSPLVSRFTFLFDSFGHAISISIISFVSPSSSVKSGLLAVQLVLMLCSQSHNNFFPLFSITFPLSHLSVYHFVPSGNNPLSIAHCTANTFNALSCVLTYSDPAIVLHPASRCWTVSLDSTQSTLVLIH